MISPKGRILLCCYEVSGFGGAATAAYSLFEQMLEDGLDVYFLNLVEPADASYFCYLLGDHWGNPAQRPRVETCVLNDPLFGPQPELVARVAALQPDVLVGEEFIATVLLSQSKQAGFAAPLVYLTAGCRQAKEELLQGEADDAMSLLAMYRRGIYWPARFVAATRNAVRAADLILTHSPLVQEFFLLYYPLQGGKIYDRIIWKFPWIAQRTYAYTHLARPFAERELDVLFIASDWARHEKNVSMVRSIAARAEGLSLHLAGNCPEALPHVTRRGFVPEPAALFALMGNARVVVCPSRLDAAPGILWEAALLGCNVVASRNCGNWMLCHPDLLAEPYTAAAFLACIRRAVVAKLEDNLRFFEQADSYQAFLTLLAVL